MKKLMLIINPISGTGDKSGLAQLAGDRLKSAGMELDIRLTTCKGNATSMAYEAVEKGYDGVIAAGGDGTINETAIALCNSGLPLGIIPCGSGNGLARHFGIQVDAEHAIDIIARQVV